MRRLAETLSWPEERGFAIDAAVDERLGFLRRTYLHLLLELCAIALVTSVAIRVPAVLENSTLLGVVGLVGILFLVPRLLARGASRASQYVASALCVGFYGVLLTPLAYYVHLRFGSYALLGHAFVITACIFAGLTAYVFVTRKDFSAWGGALTMVTLGLLGFAVVSLFFGGLGANPLFSIVVIVVMSGWVLYDTSQILHRYHVDQYVAASVALLIDFVNIFYRVALLLMRSRD